MPRRDKRKIEKTNNPYAPFSFKEGSRRLYFVPKFFFTERHRPKSRIMDLEGSRSRPFKIFRRK